MKLLLAVVCLFSVAFGSPTGRIVGGGDAEQDQFPYQISLRKYGSHSCGGSILDETTILCAAHCVLGANVKYMAVRLGNNRLNSQTEEYKVKSYVVHEKYNAYQIYNDISIIKLAKPIKFRKGVQPIKLRQINIGDNDKVVLSGWGTTTYPGSIPDKLQFIGLKTISVKECTKRHSQGSGLPIFDTEVCTLTHEGEGACHGDSGGPLVDSNGEQVGIVSWGNPCARGFPDVFTRVYSFLDWIKSNRQ